MLERPVFKEQDMMGELPRTSSLSVRNIGSRQALLINTIRGPTIHMRVSDSSTVYIEELVWDWRSHPTTFLDRYAKCSAPDPPQSWEYQIDLKRQPNSLWYQQVQSLSRIRSPPLFSNVINVRLFEGGGMMSPRHWRTLLSNEEITNKNTWDQRKQQLYRDS